MKICQRVKKLVTFDWWWRCIHKSHFSRFTSRWVERATWNYSNWQREIWWREWCSRRSQMKHDTKILSFSLKLAVQLMITTSARFTFHENSIVLLVDDKRQSSQSSSHIINRWYLHTWKKEGFAFVVSAPEVNYNVHE